MMLEIDKKKAFGSFRHGRRFGILLQVKGKLKKPTYSTYYLRITDCNIFLINIILCYTLNAHT